MIRLACIVAVWAICEKFTTLPGYICAISACIIYLVTGGWTWVHLLAKTFKRDMHFLSWIFNLVIKMAGVALRGKSHADMLHANVLRNPDKLAFIDADTKKFLSFKQAEEMCYKIANVFYEAGCRKGDVIALVMENRVEYMTIWLGLSMIGVSTSLINYNLQGESLKHCFKVCNCRAVIFSRGFKRSIKDVEDDMEIEVYCFDTCDELHDSCKDLGKLLKTAPAEIPPTCPDIKLSDTLVYLYTSGTTGLPKAVPKSRLMILGLMFALGYSSYITSQDTLYQTLPLYHGNGLGFASNCFFSGGTTVIKKKFSASKFVEDCCKYKVTVINYIGEICRYILSQPKTVFDEIVTLRLAVGNGLRASLWQEFQNRFSIEKVIEFYGATESNFFFINLEGKVGSIGYQLVWFPWLSNVRLVKTSSETGEILRDSKGLAIKAGNGESGQPVGLITKATKFEGYTNKEATLKKISHDILSLGDSAFLSGDILVKDAEGYLYFQDRLGDTFRWKGENVSTNEVEGLISKVLKLTDVCVYGVEVPGNEGKAGMACIMDPEKTTDVGNLPKALDEVLPWYAQPQFIRLSTKVEMTGTFKFQKNKLKNEGFDPDLCTGEECLFYFDKKKKKYQCIDTEIYCKIKEKAITF